MATVPGGTVEANGLSFLVLDPQGGIRHDFQFNPSLNDGVELADRRQAAACKSDAARRRSLIADLWAADGIHVTRAAVSRGHAGVDAAIAAQQADWAARALVLGSIVRSQAHHRVAWFQSSLTAKGSDRIGGIVSRLVIVGDDGRIDCDYEFEEPA
jgi:hypothetical protein